MLRNIKQSLRSLATNNNGKHGSQIILYNSEDDNDENAEKWFRKKRRDANEGASHAILTLCKVVVG